MKTRKAWATRSKSAIWDLRVEETHTNEMTGEVSVTLLWSGVTDVADPRKHVIHARDKYRARSYEIVDTFKP